MSIQNGKLIGHIPLMIVAKSNQKYNGKIINSIKTVSETPINAKKALKIRTFFVYLFIPTPP